MPLIFSFGAVDQTQISCMGAWTITLNIISGPIPTFQIWNCCSASDRTNLVGNSEVEIENTLKKTLFKWNQPHRAKDYGPHLFVLQVFYYSLLTISVHKGPWTIHECKMDTAQIDSVTSHRHIWIMRFSCSLSHNKHISVTDLSKTWLGKGSLLRVGISWVFTFWKQIEANSDPLNFKSKKKLDLA